MKIIIRTEDCMEVMRRIPDESIDVTVTSPPYNIGIDYASYSDKRTQPEYLEWLGQVFAEIARITKPGGSFFLNVGATNVNPWLAGDVARVAADSFVLQNSIIWVKSIAIDDVTYGHFKPINSQRFLNNTYENIYHFTKTGKVPLDRRAAGVPFMDKSNTTRWGHGETRRCRGNVWHIPYETIVSRESGRGGHPATYPVGLAEQALKLHGVGEGSVVFDPFLGTGSTGVAAVRLGASFIGAELDEGYSALAKERIASELQTGKE